MEATLNKRKVRMQRITGDISMRKRTQSETSKNGLIMKDMAYWQTVAKRLDTSVLPNDITMQEIVDEVNAVRKERYEKQNRF